MEAHLIMVLCSLKNIQAFPIVLRIVTRIPKVSYKARHDPLALLSLFPCFPGNSSHVLHISQAHHFLLTLESSTGHFLGPHGSLVVSTLCPWIYLVNSYILFRFHPKLIVLCVWHWVVCCHKWGWNWLHTYSLGFQVRWLFFLMLLQSVNIHIYVLIGFLFLNISHQAVSFMLSNMDSWTIWMPEITPKYFVPIHSWKYYN